MKTKIIINARYNDLKPFIENLPSIFEHRGETIYGGRNEIKIIQFEDLRINVKFFKIPNPINQLVYGNFRLSKARRSFEYARILLKNGINTPDPIAYIEMKQGICFKKSYYISMHEEFDGMMRKFKTCDVSGNEDLLSQFAGFTAELHEKQILHKDYSPGNILFKKNGTEYKFYLVDLNRMLFKKISMEEGCYNFRRLWGSEATIAFIAKEYAIARGFDPEKCVELTLQYYREFWKKFTKRHKDVSPYIGQDASTI